MWLVKGLVWVFVTLVLVCLVAIGALWGVKVHERSRAESLLKKGLWGISLTLIVICLVEFGMLWGLTIRGRNRAQAFLSDVVKLELGKATFAEAQQLALKHGGIPANDGLRCSSESCVFRFVFENKPLTSARLVPYTRFSSMVSVKNGLVVERDILYERQPNRSDPFAYSLTDNSLSSDNQWWQHFRQTGLWRLNVDERGVPRLLQVSLGPSSTADQRKRAYALDLSCLSRLFGCNSPTAVFPPDIPYRATPYYQTRSETW